MQQLQSARETPYRHLEFAGGETSKQVTEETVDRNEVAGSLTDISGQISQQNDTAMIGFAKSALVTVIRELPTPTPFPVPVPLQNQNQLRPEQKYLQVDQQTRRKLIYLEERLLSLFLRSSVRSM